MAHAAATLFDNVDPTPVTLPLPRARQAALGQFFTPPGLATFMAGLFSPPAGPVRLLDAGAGEGALTVAFIERWRGLGSIAGDAYEIDDGVMPLLSGRLAELSTDDVTVNAIPADFLGVAATMIRLKRGPRYTHAILNPPYRKITTGSSERRLAAAVGLETVNLYSAFVGLALELTQPGGEVVAIIPRSFCNGPYYRPFRKWLLDRAAIGRIHLFGSRRDAFSGDDVLQENVILLLQRGAVQDDVVVSTSTGADFADLTTSSHPSVAIVAPNDPDLVISIPTGNDEPGSTATSTLADLGLDVATGPVVDFRLADDLRRDRGSEDVPLLYAQHLRRGRVAWPLDGKKPNAIARNDATAKWLVPKGWYVIVKRFSSKEERRRVVATLCDPAALPADALGVDNKLNLIRRGKAPLPEMIARGLTVYLNTSDVDRAFRLFSGHTQVNASDLRRMKVPTWTQLEAIGRAAGSVSAEDQETIDACVAAVMDQ